MLHQADTTTNKETRHKTQIDLEWFITNELQIDCVLLALDRYFPAFVVEIDNESWALQCGILQNYVEMPPIQLFSELNSDQMLLDFYNKLSLNKLVCM